ncbi:MAG: PAS domain S-box protein [Deltaproteobacteria bacterium]|nr:PAS domain S-box protein [Candidatus Zymogenaceae bacterium]
MKRTAKKHPQTDSLSSQKRENEDLKKHIERLTKEVQSSRENETRFREIVKRSYDIIFMIHPDTTITFVSQSVKSVIGLSPRQVIGTSVFDYLPSDEQNTVRDHISEALAGKNVPNFQLSVHRKDGLTATIEANFTPIVRDGEIIGIQGIARDLTARKNMEQALKDTNEKYRLVVENSHEAITITQEGTIKYANPRALEISGYTLEELTALSSYMDIIHPDDRLEVFEQEAYRWENNIPMHGYEFRIIDKAGTVKTLHINTIFILWDERRASLEFMNDITKQKKTEAALRHTTDQYRLVVENAYEAITITQDGTIKYTNPRAVQIIGYSTEELLSLPSYMELIHPDDRRRVLENESVSRNETDVYRYDFRINTKKGETRWIEINAVNIEWEGRHASLDFLTDVTDRTLAKNALTESEEKYRQVVENAHEAITITQDYTIKYANPRAVEMSGYSMEEIQSGSYMDFLVHPDDREQLLEHDDLRTDQLTFTYEFRYITKDNRTRWAEVNAVFIQWEGKEASLDFIQDVTDRKEAECALRESEEKYRLVSENANEGIMIVQDGTFQYVNPKTLSITGFTESDAVGRSFLEFLHPDDVEMVRQNHQKRLNGEDVPDHYSFRIIDNFGRTRWIDNHPVVMNWHGKMAVLNFITDITERKKNEEELHQYRNHLEELVSQRTNQLSETNTQLRMEIRERKLAEKALIQSEKKYRDLIGNIDDIIYIVDDEGRIRYTNDAFERISGYKTTDLNDKVFSEIIVPESFVRAEEIYKEQLRGKNVGTFELEFFAKDGSIIVLEIKERLVWNKDRVIEIHGIGRDVTEKKRAEEALRKSEEKYRLVVENAQEAITITQNGIIKYANPRALEIGGYDMHELSSLPFIEIVHPDDREKIVDQDSIRSQEVSRTYDFRILTKDGRIRWIEMNTVTVEWEGEMAFLDLFNDITERKEAQERLAESEARYRELVENINDILFDITVDGSITYISPAIERILGIKPEDFIGNGYHRFIHPEDLSQLRKKVIRTRIGEQEPFEFRMLTADGDIRHIRTSARLNTENGVPKSLIGVATDITVEKEALEKLESSRTQLDAQYRSIPLPTYTWQKTDDDFTLIDCNDAAIKITQGGVNDFIGIRLSEMYEHDPQTRADMHRCFTEKKLITQEMNYRFKTTNIVRHLIVYYSYVPQNLVLVHTMDITDRKKAEKRLADSEARYRGIVEDQTELVCRFKKDGTLTFVNPAFCRYYNTPEDELLGKNLSLFSHDEDREMLKAYFDSFTKDEPIKRNEHRTVLTDGTVRWQHWSDRALFDESGTLIEFQSTGRDITERIHAEQELIRAKDELDDKVKERTINLNEAKEKLERELVERLFAEKSLKESRKEAQMLSKKLLTAQEDERKRIAQELHDSVGQLLSTIKFQVENACEDLARSYPGGDISSLKRLVPAIQMTIKEIRGIVKNLRPSLLDDLGILATISWFVRNFMSSRPGIQVDSHLYIHEHEIPEHLKIIIYRILQESFNNIAKHGQADQITLLLRKNNGNIELSIEDNGTGFDEIKAGNLEKSGLAFGITSMRERVIFSGGSFTMNSEEGEGTIIQASWPFKETPLTRQDLS